MMETKENPAYPHAEVRDITYFSDGEGWHGLILTPEVGRIWVYAHPKSTWGPAWTSYRFTRDGVDYSATELRYRRYPRGASIVARRWQRTS